MPEEKEFSAEEIENFEEELKSNVEVFVTSKPCDTIPSQRYGRQVFIEMEPKEFLRLVKEFKPVILVKVPIVTAKVKKRYGTLYLFVKWDYTFFTVIKTKGEKNE